MTRALFSQQVDLSVVAEQLHVGRALIQNQPVEGAAGHERELRPGGTGAFPGPECAEKANQLGGLGAGHAGEGRHPGSGKAVTNDGGEFLIVYEEESA